MIARMGHWLATHYPHGTPDETPWFIYLPRRPSPERTPEIGDDVLFYETKDPGPTNEEGCGAIVCAAKVSGPLEAANSKSGGRPWQIPCTALRCGRPVSFKEVVRLTRHKVLTGQDGLFRLDGVEFAALVAVFGGADPSDP